MRQAERVQEAGNVVQLHDSQHSSSDSLMAAEGWQGSPGKRFQPSERLPQLLDTCLMSGVSACTLRVTRL